MKLLRLSIFLALVMAMTACNKDDDDASTCTQSDWVGTYKGTQDCDGDTENVTVTIIARGSNEITIKYETATVTTEFNPLTPAGCDLDQTDSAGGLTLVVDASINGDQLTFKDILSDGSTTTTCTITATRQ